MGKAIKINIGDWVRFLPEVGNPIIKELHRLQKWQKEIDTEVLRYLTEENELLEQISELWSESDIAKAIKDCKQGDHKIRRT